RKDPPVTIADELQPLDTPSTSGSQVTSSPSVINTDCVLSPPSPVTIQNQQTDHFFASIIQYLQTGQLPTDRQQARRIILQSEHYIIENDVLVHLGINRHKRLHQIEPLIHQLCIPPEQRLPMLSKMEMK
ncbi:MAG: hypothetical protein MUF50_02095, partial [Planctomycetes bacterium]|nr:hypothetical protein [Planctomycetota bacterium]